jgi:hypothetical protein
MARIPFEIQPGSGCPGGVVEKGPRAGKAEPSCFTCTRLGGHELEPAVRLVHGEPRCVNFLELGAHAGMVAADATGRETADRGAAVAASTPMGGAG